jgi:branched-chain amino acid transport system ATP-binding protein
MLEVRGIDAGYGDTKVLWNVSLRVDEGEVVALVGSNGAGKTTLLSTISGLIRTRKGSIWLDGKEVTHASAADIVRAGLVHVPEGRRLFPALSVRENLLLGAYLRKDAAKVKADFDRVLSLFPILAERHDQLAGKLSGGEQQMCAIGRGLMSAPRLLMIDELSLGLAPIMVEQIIDTLRQVNRDGTTLLIVEQDVETALGEASRAYVLEAGEITLSGPAKELLGNEAVRKAYLGV